LKNIDNIPELLAKWTMARSLQLKSTGNPSPLAGMVRF